MNAARANGSFARIADIQDQRNAAAILSDRFGEAAPRRSGHPDRPQGAERVARLKLTLQRYTLLHEGDLGEGDMG